MPDTIWVNGNYGNEFQLTREQAERGSHQGDCESDVRELMTELDLTGINPVSLRKELTEYGAWNDKELADHQENLMRWVWICCADVIDGKYELKESL